MHYRCAPWLRGEPHKHARSIFDTFPFAEGECSFVDRILAVRPLLLLNHLSNISLGIFSHVTVTTFLVSTSYGGFPIR